MGSFKKRILQLNYGKETLVKKQNCGKFPGGTVCYIKRDSFSRVIIVKIKLEKISDAIKLF